MDYEVTEYKEIYREVFAGLLADIDREIEKRGISDQEHPLYVFQSKINLIWGEILSEKYSTMEDMLKLKGIFEFSQDYVKGLAPGKVG